MFEVWCVIDQMINSMLSEQDVDELLQCVCDADSAQEVEEFGSVLVQRLRLAQQRRNDITAQEMKAVMEERDGSVAKVTYLCDCSHCLVQSSDIYILLFWYIFW